ncbi:MAG TPA: rhodanese-like domain-containing protein [Kofleriaceae bacterium]|nr:rhodanese-like domain-containing protein [Kofleriaceae bacterium]
MNRTLSLVLAGAFAISGSACSKQKAGDSTAAQAEALRKLTVDEVSTRLAANDGKTFVFDNNSRESWVKEHVPGAKWVDDEHVTADVLPADKAATLIFYCHDET